MNGIFFDIKEFVVYDGTDIRTTVFMNDSGGNNSMYRFFSPDSIKPLGWLKQQLQIQAEGLSGHLDLIWPDIRDSAWIGGDREGWERVPYWLDGFIPLAYLLEDKELISRAKKYIDAILERQNADGWICPCAPDQISNYDTWAVQLISKVFVVYYNCSGDERIPGALRKMMKNYYDLLSGDTIRLFDWGKSRWFESLIALNFLYERDPEPWIRELAVILRDTGFDYEAEKEHWVRPLNKWTHGTHVVNLAMMLKTEAVSKTLLGDCFEGKAKELYDFLMKYNGTPAGIFTGDECLSGRSPIQGTELCAVAELMYSCELLTAATGDMTWADVLELVAFNALPGTISDDMWAHQYDQMSNQISCERFPGKAIFRTNSNEAHLFGLEPNFGCCTANFNQAWPKLALSAFMKNGNTVLSPVALPSELIADGIHIRLETEYPFKNELCYTVEPGKAFTLQVKVPSTAVGVCVNGTAVKKENLLSFDIAEGAAHTIRVAFSFTPRLVDACCGLSALRWGNLLFALPIEYEDKKIEYEKNGVERKYPYCDHEYVGRTEWRYRFAGKEFHVNEHAVSTVPFSSSEPPVTISVPVCRINWEFEDGYETVPAKFPADTSPIGETEQKEFYPYGCTKLRMTQLPYSGT